MCAFEINSAYSGVGATQATTRRVNINSGGRGGVAPMPLDRMSSTGLIVPGWAPFASDALGAGMHVRDQGRR